MPAIADEVTDFERPQHQHERAGREVAEHAAPGRADGESGAGDQCGERRRLDPEIAEDAEDQRDVQRIADDRSEVLRERRVDLTRFIAARESGRCAYGSASARRTRNDRRENLDADFDRGRTQKKAGRASLSIMVVPSGFDLKNLLSASPVQIVGNLVVRVGSSASGWAVLRLVAHDHGLDRAAGSSARRRSARVRICRRASRSRVVRSPGGPGGVWSPTVS